jgi:hypothetical protein
MLGAMIGDDSTGAVYGLFARTRDTQGVLREARMRRVLAMLVVLLTAGCSAALPAGVDGELTDDWPVPAPAAPFRPVAAECHEALAETVAARDHHPVGCAELHVAETYLVGSAADASVVPAPGTPQAVAAFQDCSRAADTFLDGSWRTARVAVRVVWPTRAGWSGGARWFRCDLSTADLDGQGGTSRTGSLAGALAGPSPLRLACFDPAVDDGTVTTMRAVPCGSAHRAEFAGLWRAPDVSYADLETDTRRSAAGCRSVIARFARLPDDSDMQYRSGWISYNPTRTEWLSGERRVRCFLYFARRTVTRSLKNAGPAALPVR